MDANSNVRAQVAPANPAQVTDAMVEEALAAYSKRFPLGVEPHRDGMRAALTAAIGAGWQAVAWRVSCPDDEIYGRGPDTVRFHPLSPDEIASGYTQQPLYTHPADERVVEALDADYLRQILAWVRRNFEEQPNKAKEQIDLALGHIVSVLSEKEAR